MIEFARQTPPPSGHHWKIAAMVVVISSVIAVFDSLMGSDRGHLAQELFISNAIGGCIWLLIEVLQKLSRDRLGVIPCMLIAVPGGIILGGKAAALFGAFDIIGAWTHDPVNQWKSIMVTLLFATSASAFVILFWQAVNYRLQFEGERRRSAEAGRAQAVAELGLLQAQIEPHFLFNTLAHVQSAIEEEPAVGKAMLEHLIQYLRGTLRRSRVSRYTLMEEVDLVESLLAIAAIRLGKRLQYRIIIPDDLRAAALPPLLLQPLVENAIKHGIEASLEGGEIRIESERSDGLLVLRVLDSGVGIEPAAPEGVGLSNVRARLASLYGETGRLSLLRNDPRGIVAELRLPLQFV